MRISGRVTVIRARAGQYPSDTELCKRGHRDHGTSIAPPRRRARLPRQVPHRPPTATAHFTGSPAIAAPDNRENMWTQEGRSTLKASTRRRDLNKPIGCGTVCQIASSMMAVSADRSTGGLIQLAFE